MYFKVLGKAHEAGCGYTDLRAVCARRSGWHAEDQACSVSRLPQGLADPEWMLHRKFSFREFLKVADTSSYIEDG